MRFRLLYAKSLGSSWIPNFIGFLSKMAEYRVFKSKQVSYIRENGDIPPNLSSSKISFQMYFNIKQHLSYKPSGAPEATRGNLTGPKVKLGEHTPTPLPGAVCFARLILSLP